MLSEEGKNIWASVVVVDKLRYTGLHLKPIGGRQANPIMFRNYILRRLLEHHFHYYPLQSQQYDLVLDRIDLNKMQADNLWQYLSNNHAIPKPSQITHASSIYVDNLQVVHHIANGFKNFTSDGLVPNELSFVNLRDLTENQDMLTNK
jgi:hypothetical protein